MLDGYPMGAHCEEVVISTCEISLVHCWFLFYFYTWWNK
jgi:hypothetical protein